MATVARTQQRTRGMPAAEPAGEHGEFRRRLLDGLAASIVERGYRDTTIADIVRHARTSRRTFYEHFAGKEACLIALVTEANARVIEQIDAAVDPRAPWQTQVRQAIETWIATAESQPAITRSWIREVPTLGEEARVLQREGMAAFVALVLRLCDTAKFRSAHAGPVSEQLAIVLIGGLRELIATQVEDGRPLRDLTPVAVDATIALLGPRP